MFRLASIILLVAEASAFSSSSAFVNRGGLAPVINSQSALCMKTIVVFGASGLTASECVYQALANGDNVIGLTRNPSKLVIPQGSGGAKAGGVLSDPKLTMIAGDVTKMADVQKVFAAADSIDGVVVALGGKTSDVGDSMLTDGTNNVIKAMKDKGVKRLSVVTSIGAGDSENQAPFFFKVLMWTGKFLMSYLLYHSMTSRRCSSLTYSRSTTTFSHEKDLCRQEQPRSSCCQEWTGVLHCPSRRFNC